MKYKKHEENSVIQPLTLCYTFDALEPYVSQKTMEEHYHVFYQGYIDKLNNDPDTSSPKFTHNLGGFLNHNDFWYSLKPPTGEPVHHKYFPHASAILQVADTLFGSGYVWIGETGNIFCTPNQTRPAEKTLLCIDCYEHAFIHDYTNNRGEYLRNIFNVLAWEKIDAIIP